MTTIDGHVVEVRATAANLKMPNLSTVLVVLIGIVPFLLGWLASAVAQFGSLLLAAAVHGWRTGQRQMGTQARTGGS